MDQIWNANHAACDNFKSQVALLLANRSHIGGGEAMPTGVFTLHVHPCQIGNIKADINSWEISKLILTHENQWHA